MNEEEKAEQTAARVKAGVGAQFLDAAYPEWFQRINVDMLDVHDCDNCILGQIAGSDVSPKSGYTMFCSWSELATSGKPLPDYRVEYGSSWRIDHGFAGFTTAAWKREIASRIASKLSAA